MGTKKKNINRDANNRTIAVNKQARRLFTIDQTFVAGLVLLGSEVKSLRAGHITIGDGYVESRGDELFLMNVHIKEYAFSGRFGHEPLRHRKLLLNEREIRQVTRSIQEKGCTCVPMKFFFQKGYVKVEIGLGKGKKLHDRRHDLKERDSKREMERAMKQ
jgi:SsrA-binding protein